MLVLQLMKFFIHDDSKTTNKLYNTNNNESSLLHSDAQNDTFTFQGMLKNVKNLLFAGESYDVDRFEATKTDIVNVVDRLSDDSTNGTQTFPYLSRPYVSVKSFYNFTELIQYNNFRNMVKIAYVLNLNLTTVMINLIVLSYILIKRKRFSVLNGRYNFKREFFKMNIFINLVLLAALLVFNTVYLCLFGSYLKKQSAFSTVSKLFHEYISRLFNDDYDPERYDTLNVKIPETSDLYLVEYKAKSTSLLQYSPNLDRSQNCPYCTQISTQFSAIFNIKMNLILMIIFVTLVTFYSYFLNVDENEDFEINEEIDNEPDEEDDDDDETDSESEAESELADLESDDDELLDGETKNKQSYEISEKKLIMLNESDNGSDQAYIRLKQKKIEKKIDINLLWIIDCIFVIYVLSILDVSSVYQYFKIQNANTTQMQHLLGLGGNNGDLIRLNDYLTARTMQADIDSLRNHTSYMGSVVLHNNYTNLQYNSFFHNQLEQFKELAYRKTYQNETYLNEEYSQKTHVSAFFVLKMHSKYFTGLLIIIFSLVIFHKLFMIEYLLEFDHERLMVQNYQYHRSHLDI